MKIAIENIKTKTFPLDLCAIQLLLSCTYTNSLKKKGNELEDNPDNLVHLLEKVSIIFDHIKKGFPFQVQILCSILPDILNYFFTPADILTKVLGEFLSQQQPHPKLLSSVVFKVFENSINQSQLPLLQDWVVFSLSNFTNSFSMSMATWYLSCFFVSASTNPWLRSFFPYMQARIGRFEYEDRKMLCIAGADFYKNLTNDKQRQTFIDSFDKVKDQIDSPFNDLLSSVEL
ncbi:huntingtin-like [Agrilus planipennis]|nr:huntingtin-like [Agrilus planipennis]